jgi:6-pyruvoyltetrahydropterin/6-carboxytetrahydropterin synthase
MFTLRVRDKFCAAHQLVGYPGDCAKLHGHTWKVEVVIEGPLLDEMEMLIEFRDIKGAMKEVISPLDHSYLNDILGMDLPTAEYLAWYIFHEIKGTLEHVGLPLDTELKEVTVWESENASVTYDREEYD